MKIINTQVDIGDMVLIEEKYCEKFHYLKHNRLHIGFVKLLDDDGIIEISKKKLVNPKQLKINKIRNFFKIFYNIGIANFGETSHIYLDKSQIKSIRVLL